MKPSNCSAFWLTFSSGMALVFSFYPVGLPGMGWVAPVGVLWLVWARQLPGNRPRLQIWLASFLCWLLLFQCTRLPHWAGYIGWPFLAAYLGSYLFFFVLVARHWVHRWKIPVVISAPVAWVGLEYMQAHLFSGISLGMLSHTQIAFPIVIQVADLAGCYTVSFFMVAIVAALVSGFRQPKKKPRLLGLCLAVGLSVVLGGYGALRIRNADQLMTRQDFKVALVQGSRDTLFPDESQYRAYIESFTRHYLELSQRACQEEVDLVVWPESMFPVPDFYTKIGENLVSAERQKIHQSQQSVARVAQRATRMNELEGNVPMIVGANSIVLGADRKLFNSGILIGRDGRVVERYGKMKLVLFGEFVPLGDVFPWLYSLFPIPPGLQPGAGPVAMELEGFVFSPNICFESTYPHLIRHHYNDLLARGQKPDVLVNLSNDGWFWGSTALDMHFANTVLRSVENRVPTLVASNTGFSAQVDSAGRVIAKGPRRKAKVIRVDLWTSEQTSPYHQIGDWPAFFCLLPVLGCFLQWIWLPFFSGKLQLIQHREDSPRS
ncbi:MAG: apolipoprotein N-acyltransferase [Planctomycetota bacterium]|nr:apolipoprotein N-acyltransferase [Planctomycetota bacterium]